MIIIILYIGNCMVDFSLKAISFCLLSIGLVGCGSDGMSQLNQTLQPNQPTTLVNNYQSDKQLYEESIGKKIVDVNANMSTNTDLEKLKAQLEQQQQQLSAMNAEQQALQTQLKRQTISLQILPSADANAGRQKQGTASIAHIAFLEDESQFSELLEMATKEVSVIPSRQTALKLNVPQEARFIAIKVGLRYTKKRSQLLIPISSIDFEKPLTLNVGACDVNIKEGIIPELAPIFAIKLKYYQQPLVGCA